VCLSSAQAAVPCRSDEGRSSAGGEVEHPCWQGDEFLEGTMKGTDVVGKRKMKGAGGWG